MSYPVPRIETETLTTPAGQTVSFRMIEVLGGEFDMGSEDEDAGNDEKPIHKVNIPTFWIGEFPVTQALWQTIMGENPSYFPGMDRPVEQVSWLDITERFLPTLNKLSGQDYRLPSEAEWEYAARGGVHHSPFRYAGSNRLEDVAWHGENSHLETKTVGLKQPNNLGIYDITGNVYEWCADWYDYDYYQFLVEKWTVENPTGPQSGRYRISRGGSWAHDPKDCRVTNRLYEYPSNAGVAIGFRIVASLGH